MDRSSAITITAERGRGDAVRGDVPSDYAVLLPALPTGEDAKCSLVLHADTRGRPYRVEDFVGPLNQAGVRKDIAGLGAFQMGHVWLVKFHTIEAKEKLLSAGTLQVKDRLCLIVDPERRELKVKIHWVAFGVSVEAIRRVFESFGEVKEVTREKWKVAGLMDVDSTTVTVRIVLRESLTPESLPHQLRLNGGTVLVVVPGRAPLCLRCHRTGHIRRDCKVPRCGECRAFGHEARDCVRTYARAAAVANRTCEDSGASHLMDEAEAEAAASSTKEQAPPADAQGMDNGTSVAQQRGPLKQEKTDLPKLEQRLAGDTRQVKKGLACATTGASTPTSALDGDGGDAMDSESTSIKRRLSDTVPENDEPQQLAQDRGSGLQHKKGRNAGRGLSSSLPREDAREQ